MQKKEYGRKSNRQFNLRFVKITIRLIYILILSGLLFLVTNTDSRSDTIMNADSVIRSGQDYLIESIPDSINNVTLIKFAVPQECFIKLYFTDSTTNEKYILAERRRNKGR